MSQENVIFIKMASLDFFPSSFVFQSCFISFLHIKILQRFKRIIANFSLLAIRELGGGWKGKEICI